jgi:hypothetical protein
MSDLMKVGNDFGTSGTFKPFTSSLSGSQRVNDAHGRFLDAALGSRLFSGGAGLTSIANATFTIATLGATATPVIGLWNPLSSPVNAAILQATLATIMTALQATGPGGYQWAVSVGNGALTLGSFGFSRKTLVQSGGYCKNMSGVALTGLTNNLVAMQGSGLGGGSSYNLALLATAAGFQTQQVTSIENLDGGIIIPPGGVIALLATTTPVAHSVVPSILWEELPILP